MAGILAEKLIELLEMDALARARPIEAPNDQCIFFYGRKMRDLHIHDIIVRQQGAGGPRRQVLQFKDALQIAGSELGDIGAQFIGPDRAVDFVVLDHEQLALNA